MAYGHRLDLLGKTSQMPWATIASVPPRLIGVGIIVVVLVVTTRQAGAEPCGPIPAMEHRVIKCPLAG